MSLAMFPGVRRPAFAGLCPSLLGLALLSPGCGPDGPADDDIGATESGATDSTDSSSTGSGTADATSSTDSSDSGSTDSGSTDSDSSSTGSTDSESSSTDSSDTGSTDAATTTAGEIVDCFPAPGETIWDLGCENCTSLWTDDPSLVRISVVGSQIPADILACGHYQFEGTVMEHPSPTQWVIDACPCDLECLLPDPHSIDLADGLPHPAPEILPTELGTCVRVDVFKSGSLGGLETLCTPEAIALWSLDGNQPLLRYAQGGSNDDTFPIDLGDLDLDNELDCTINNGNEELQTFSVLFDLAGDAVLVHEQHEDILVTDQGDYRAVNVVAQDLASNFERTLPAFWWVLHPQP
ncbi:MAG: hypothetical protein KC457_19295 [Myxococcales bacterium]|nr:hypothetical protein [Myxococcales bacterium]